MEVQRSLGPLAGTIIAAGLVIVGVWLPLAGKQPAGTINGQPVYTADEVPGVETGFQGADPYIALLMLGVVATTAVLLHLGRRPNLVSLVAGGLLILWSGPILFRYVTSDRYVAEMGLYLVIAGGALLLLVGGESLLKRLVAAVMTQKGSPRDVS